MTIHWGSLLVGVAVGFLCRHFIGHALAAVPGGGPASSVGGS
jgi:hypothetical protein